MLTMKKSISLLLFTMISVVGAFAQIEEQKEEVSGEELKQFASAFQQVQTVNQQVQQRMIKAVEETGLDVQRYNEIQQAQQDPNQEVNVSDEELEQYTATTQELEKIQAGAQQEIQGKITEQGLTVNRYQEIAAALQNDTELQQKLQEYL